MMMRRRRRRTKRRRRRMRRRRRRSSSSSSKWWRWWWWWWWWRGSSTIVLVHTSNLARVVCSNSNRDSSSLVRSSNLRCAKDELVSPCVSILSRRDDSSANCSLRAARSLSNSATRPACSCRAIWSTDNCWTTVRYFFSTCKTCNVH